MDFQLARNLSALARAQEETTKALLHIDSLADCLNREIIMAAASSEATEQLVTAAKTSLYQIQAILAAQSEEGVDFVVRKFHSSQLGVNALQVLLHPMCLSQTVKDQQLSRRVRRVLIARDTATDGHSYAQTAIRGNLWRHDDF